MTQWRWVGKLVKPREGKKRETMEENQENKLKFNSFIGNQNNMNKYDARLA